MWGIIYSILECGTYIDCHINNFPPIQNLTKPKQPANILCRHFIAEKAKLPNYCIETPEEPVDVIEQIS